MRIADILLKWSRNYIADFDDKMLFTLRYMADLMPGIFQSTAQKLLNNASNCDYLYHDFGSLSFKGIPVAPVVKPVDQSIPKYNWLADVDAVRLGDQFTCIEWEIFTSLEVRSF
jgi:hypothetical protein